MALVKELLTLILKFIHMSNQFILSCPYLLLNAGGGLKTLEKTIDPHFLSPVEGNLKRFLEL